MDPSSTNLEEGGLPEATLCSKIKTRIPEKDTSAASRARLFGRQTSLKLWLCVLLSRATPGSSMTRLVLGVAKSSSQPQGGGRTLLLPGLKSRDGCAWVPVATVLLAQMHTARPRARSPTGESPHTGLLARTPEAASHGRGAGGARAKRCSSTSSVFLHLRQGRCRHPPISTDTLTRAHIHPHS